LSEQTTSRYQRKGSTSNAHAGSEFEGAAETWLKLQGIEVDRNFSIEVGFSFKKLRNFDLGCRNPAVLVECKSHKWTESDNMPSAKMTVWNEAMLYFSLAPAEFRKILFVLKDISRKRKETLAQYYLRTHANLIPNGVEIWEFDALLKTASRLV
jgi:hypothetical protein